MANLPADEAAVAAAQTALNTDVAAVVADDAAQVAAVAKDAAAIAADAAALAADGVTIAADNATIAADKTTINADNVTITTDKAAYAAAQTTIGLLQGQLSAANAKLAAVFPGGQTYTGTTPVILGVGATNTGNTYLAPSITAAQIYAVEINDNSTINNITAKSGSGGIRAGGPKAPTPSGNITVNGATAIGCGQNGFSVFAFNSIFNNITTDGCNTGNFNAYNEGGDGKIWSSTNCVFNNWNSKNTQGNGPWSDGACLGLTFNGGTVQGNFVAGPNVGKQISPHRTELTSGEIHNGVTRIAGPNQNSAWIISDSNHVKDNGGVYKGQVGIVDNGRKTATTSKGQVIDTTLHDFTFNGTTLGSFYWADTATGLTFNGVKFTQAVGQPVAYIEHVGKPVTPITLAQFQATYDPRASLV